MLDYFVYTSISSGKKLNEVESNLENSRIYKKIIKSIAFLASNPEKNASRDSFNYDKENPNGTLFVDFLMNRDKQHRKLDKIIEYVKLHHKNNGFVIIVQSISAFGTIPQIQSYYRIFQDNKIYVLCVDYSRLSGLSEYSTSNFGFDKRDRDEYERAYMLVNDLKPDAKELNNRGAISYFSEAFIESYWMYETYKIPESIAIATSGIGRSAFHRKCALYEYSGDFIGKIHDLSKEDLSTFAKQPKRFSKPPAEFGELEQIIDNKWIDNLSNIYINNMSTIEKKFDDACIELHIPTIHPINYIRLKLRQEVGRKGIAATYNYDENIINKFEEYSLNPENPLNKFWEKYKGKKL